MTICGLSAALSITEMVPFRLPEALGVQVTLIVQFPPDDRFEPSHVSVSPKFVLGRILAMLSVIVP